MDFLRHSKSPNVLSDLLVEFLSKFVGSFFAGDEGDIGVDRLPLDIMRKPDDSGLGDHLMGDERAFDFGGANAVARDVDYIVNAARDPIIAVLVAAAAIARKVEPRICLEI